MMDKEARFYRNVIRKGRMKKRIQKRTIRRQKQKIRKNTGKAGMWMLYQNKLVFSFARSIFDLIIFLPFFFFIIQDLPRRPFIWDGAKSLGWIALILFSTQTLSWILAWRLTHHSNFEKNVQFFLRGFIKISFVSVIVFTNVYLLLLANFDVKQTLVYFVLIQWIVFFIADYIADNILFQH